LRLVTAMNLCAFIVVRSWRAQAPPVLPRAATSLEERVQKSVNAGRAWGVKLLQRRENE
jgi:hypothetical protein